MENIGDNNSDLINSGFHESELIRSLRASKNRLERELDWATDALEKGKKSRQTDFKGIYFDYLDDLYRDKQEHENYYIGILFKPFFVSINISPSIFLHYCYYLKHFTFDWRKHIEQLVAHPNLLDICKQLRKGDGYSVFGAVIIAPDVPIAIKRNVIQKLLFHGFELTEKDRSLAKLYVYDVILAEQKEKMIFLLYDGHCEDCLLQLLPDIRKYIAQYFFSLLDKEHGFCIHD